ncbi:MAG: hypothetical protein M1830_004770 [Pleopsidium flavum]|nr:MAG: hypothetical protein M1830_004770 [Pleopsidium flavum]
MDFRRNLCLLPSNAPSNVEHNSTPRGILQNTSGNVQTNILEISEVALNVSLPAQVEDLHAQCPPQSVISPSDQAQLGSAPESIRTRAPPSTASSYAQSKGSRPQQRCLKGQLPILSRAELRCPEYLRYRSRQRQNLGKDGKPVWSEPMEEAFQRALREPKPFRRRKAKMESGGPQQGSNEWISRYIWMMTGEYRCRKQVSSHIQTLKRIMRKNAEWISLVAAKEPVNCSKDHAERVRYVVDEQYEIQQQHLFDAHGTPLPPYIVPSSGDTLGSGLSITPQCSIEAIEFMMWVTPPAPDNQRHEALHVYTTLQPEARRATVPLEDVPSWRSIFPHLASISNEEGIDSSIVLFETNFDLMTDNPPRRSRLGIDFFLDIANGSAYRDWEYVTSFYEKGKCSRTYTNSLRYYIDEGEGGGNTRVEMPLESSWWATFFFKITERKRERAKESGGDTAAQRHEDERCRRTLKDMSVVQEVWASPNDDLSPRRRVAILLWKFRQIRAGEAATTTWRNLVSPPPRITTNSPAPSTQEPPMTLDTTMNDHVPHPVEIYTEPFDPQAFDCLGHSPDTVSNSQPFIDYPTTTDALSGSLESIPYPISTMELQQENIGAVDFTGGHINLYCEPYAQPLPPYDEAVHYVAPEENMQQLYDDHHWAADYQQPMCTDASFHHASLAEEPGDLEQGSEHGHDEDHVLAFQ